MAFAEDKAVFIDKGIAGDTVEATIVETKKHYAYARISSIETPSPLRKESPCKVFADCGGCSYLCMDYQSEINIKKEILIDTLSRIGGIDKSALPRIDLLQGDRFRYRTHAGIKANGGEIGFFKRGCNELVPFPDSGCMLLSPALAIAKGETSFKAAVDSQGLYAAGDGSAALVESEQGIVYKRSLDCFFQANGFLRGDMLARVEEYANISPQETFLDLGCGVGFFTLYLARGGAQGLGVDVNKTAIRFAKENAVINKIKNVQFKTANSSDVNPYSQEYSVIVADPPRAGLSKKTRRTILAASPKRIVYVSCAPPTFARDAKDFISAGYSMAKLTFADMFPCTMHIETIACFERE